VVTPEKAKNMMVTRAYPIGDLVGGIGGVQGAAFPGLQAAAMREMAKSIMDMITSTVDPPSWRVNGQDGQGTIVFNPITMTLVIKNSAEVHSMLGSTFR
jgi:hypothetical protein